MSNRRELAMLPKLSRLGRVDLLNPPVDWRLGAGTLIDGADGLAGADLLMLGEGLEGIVAGGLLMLGAGLERIVPNDLLELLIDGLDGAVAGGLLGLIDGLDGADAGGRAALMEGLGARDGAGAGLGLAEARRSAICLKAELRLELLCARITGR